MTAHRRVTSVEEVVMAWVEQTGKRSVAGALPPIRWWERFGIGVYQ